MFGCCADNQPGDWHVKSNFNYLPFDIVEHSATGIFEAFCINKKNNNNIYLVIIILKINKMKIKFNLKNKKKKN